LPSNKRSAILVLLFVNGVRACSTTSELSVDNVAPSLSLLQARPSGNGILLTLKASETVRVSITSGSRLLASRTANGGTSVAVPLPRVASFVVALVDRAGNRSVSAVKVAG
jgi:hypothetical protein